MDSDTSLLAQLAPPLAMAGFLAAVAMMVWAMVDLARLRRLPVFQSALSGSLRLHLTALGLARPPAELDPASRRRIASLRRRFLIAAVCFAAAVALQLVSGVPGSTA